MARGEQDLGGIIAQVDALRQLQQPTQQTEREYRAAITQHAQTLLAICNQPDVRDILVPPDRNPLQVQTPVLVPGFYRRPDPLFQTGKISNLRGATLGRAHDYLPHESDPSPIALQIFADGRGKVSFTITYGIDYDDHALVYLDRDKANGIEDDPRMDPNRQGRAAIRRDDKIDPKIVSAAAQRDQTVQHSILPGLTNALQLDPKTPWVKFVDRYLPHSLFQPFHKAITVEDFIAHPEFLTAFENEISRRLNQAYGTARTHIETQQAVISQLNNSPLARVAEQLRANPQAYDQRTLHQIAQEAAETAIEHTNTIPLRGTTETQVRALVTQMIDERLATMQFAPDRRVVSTPSEQVQREITNIAQGDPVVEGILRRFVRRVKDPERVLQALLTLSILIPGAEKVAAIVEAINIMFGPEEHR